jgi:hypothetical protein
MLDLVRKQKFVNAVIRSAAGRRAIWKIRAACLGAFQPPPVEARGETVVVAGAENLHNSGHPANLGGLLFPRSIYGSTSWAGNQPTKD